MPRTGPCLLDLTSDPGPEYTELSHADQDNPVMHKVDVSRHSAGGIVFPLKVASGKETMSNKGLGLSFNRWTYGQSWKTL